MNNPKMRDELKDQQFFQVFMKDRLRFFTKNLPVFVNEFMSGYDLAKTDWDALLEEIDVYPISTSVVKDLVNFFDKAEQAFIVFAGNQAEYRAAQKVSSNLEVWKNIQRDAKKIYTQLRHNITQSCSFWQIW